MEQPLLKVNETYRVGVMSANVKYDSYPKKGTNQTMWCHFFVGRDMTNNELYNFQICTEQETMPFEVNDMVNVRISQYNVAKNSYTVKYVETLEHGGVSLRNQQGEAKEQKNEGPRNPNIYGTVADRALYNACHLHSMKPSNTKEVLDDAEDFYHWLLSKQKT